MGGLLQAPDRFERVLGCLLRRDLDVISMEEVDHYHDYWKPQLKEYGYDGVFHNKNISQASRFNGGSRDGVAIFYNTDRLECIFSHKFVLPDDKCGSTPGCKGTRTKDDKCSECKAKPWRGKDSTQVGLYVVLRDIKTGEIFSYVAAHCKSGKKPKDAPTKDAQAKFIANLVTMLADSGLRPALGLDFNSNYKEKVIKTFKDGAKHMVSAYEQIKELEKAYDLYKKLKLTEKTAHEPDVNGDAPMTAWKNRLFGEQLEKAGKQFKEELDYIFYEQKAWEVTRVLKVPHRKVIEECKMPGWKYPSDHFMIMAELELHDMAKLLPEAKARLSKPSVSNTLADWEKQWAAEDQRLKETRKTLDAILVDNKKTEKRLAALDRRRLAAEEVLHRRRLDDTARMEAKDVDSMSPSELTLHRRRLAYGARVSPVLAALMDEIEEAKRSHA